MMPLAGLASDLVGRRRVLIVSHLAFVVVAYPLFAVTDHGVLLAALACQLVFALLMAGVQGPIPAAMAEMFPTQTRFSGVAIGYNVSLSVFGGTAPLVSTWLIRATGDIAAPAYYLIALALASLLAALTVRPAHGRALD
jgi:MHS family proline/betaine transporter-like MFS transporter